MSTLMNQARTRVPRFAPRFAEAAVERARLTVVPRASGRRAARVPFMLLVSVLLIGGVAGLLLINTTMQQVSFHQTALEDRASVLAAQQQSLDMQLDQLRDPQHLATRARKLGMIPPADPAFIQLGTGDVLGVPTAAVPDGSFRIDPLPTKKPRLLDPKPIVEKAPVTTDGAAASSGGAAGGRKNGSATDRTGATAGTMTGRATTQQQGSQR